MIGATWRMRPISPSNASRPSHGNTSAISPGVPGADSTMNPLGASPGPSPVPSPSRSRWWSARAACIVPRHIATSSSRNAPMTPTGWSRRWRPVAGWSMPDRSSTIGVRSAPAASTTCGARTTSRRGTPSIETVASTPVARPASTSTRSTGASGMIRVPCRHASARCTRMPDCFAPRRQPKPHRPQSPQSIAVAPDLADLLAEHRAATEDQLVLGRDVRRVGDADLRGQRREVRVEHRIVEARRARGSSPSGGASRPAGRCRSSS